MVRREPLELVILVRIQASQPTLTLRRTTVIEVESNNKVLIEENA